MNTLSKLAMMVVAIWTTGGASAAENLCRELAGKYRQDPAVIQTDELTALSACIRVQLHRRGVAVAPVARSGSGSRPATAHPPVIITSEKQDAVSVGPAFDPDRSLDYLCAQPQDFVGVDPHGATVTVEVRRFAGRRRP